VTYLMKGRIHHRDSLGTDQWIEPGAVNWMLAGHGITHSERTDGEMRARPHACSGCRPGWRCPRTARMIRPPFCTPPQDLLPCWRARARQVRLILGHAWGERRPCRRRRGVLCRCDAGPRRGDPLPDDHEDRGVYILQGEVTVAGQTFPAGRMLVFRPGDRISRGRGRSGGADDAAGRGHDGWAAPHLVEFRRLVQERIEAAKEAWRAGDWAHGRFRLPPGDDAAEFIPAPSG
jgi:redox-sensitive bicupin YhaK (pirin superfamily)